MQTRFLYTYVTLTDSYKHPDESGNGLWARISRLKTLS